MTDISRSRSHEATEEMADAVRGVLQILRGKSGATFHDVRKHCQLRGDDMTPWPDWILDTEGYVTERAAATMIYDIMRRFAPSETATIKEVVSKDILLHAGKLEELLYEAQAFIERNVGVQDAYVDYEGKDRLIQKIEAHRRGERT